MFDDPRSLDYSSQGHDAWGLKPHTAAIDARLTDDIAQLSLKLDDLRYLAEQATGKELRYSDEAPLTSSAQPRDKASLLHELVNGLGRMKMVTQCIDRGTLRVEDKGSYYQARNFGHEIQHCFNRMIEAGYLSGHSKHGLLSSAMQYGQPGAITVYYTAAPSIALALAALPPGSTQSQETANDDADASPYPWLNPAVSTDIEFMERQMSSMRALALGEGFYLPPSEGPAPKRGDGDTKIIALRNLYEGYSRLNGISRLVSELGDRELGHRADQCCGQIFDTCIALQKSGYLIEGDSIEEMTSYHGVPSLAQVLTSYHQRTHTPTTRVNGPATSLPGLTSDVQHKR